jgi:hypothetical protein
MEFYFLNGQAFEKKKKPARCFYFEVPGFAFVFCL